MLQWIVLVLVVILIVSVSTVIEGYDPTQKTFRSFADRYKQTKRTYDALDANNENVNREKDVGARVTDATHIDGRQIVPGNNSWEHVRRGPQDDSGDKKQTTTYHYFGKDDYGYLPYAGDRGRDLNNRWDRDRDDHRKTNVCELLHFFVLRESSMANMMATQFTAEQKLQLQTFMEALNKYVLYVQTKRPSDASNLARKVVSNTNSSTVDVMIEFAQQQQTEDVESKKLLQKYGPIQVNPNMAAYIQAMLLVGDMTTATRSNC
jgi:hypothetical protein